MKNTSKGKFNLKAVIIKHWSNFLFFVILLLFLVPGSRIYIQSQIAYIFSTTPIIVDDDSEQHLTDYNLSLKSLDGKVVNLKKSEGKPILINFWATWCAPCIGELPELNELYTQYSNKVDFYFISNENSKTLQKFLNSNKYNLPVFNPVTKIPIPLDSKVLPSTYLIDKNGKIVALAQKAAKWNAGEIQDLINQL